MNYIRADIVPSLHKLVLPENGSIFFFFLSKRAVIGLKSSVHYQQSTLKGSYFPKSLHKLVLPENGSISIFFEVKVLLKDSKVEVRGQNPQNSNLKKPIKSRKVLQTSQFLVKSCVLDWACWNFTLNFHVYFYLWYFTLLVSKNGHFSVFYRNFACFLWGEGSKKFFGEKNTWNIS